MGGRGASAGGRGRGGGLNPANIISTRSLISERERAGNLVDETLSVMRDFNDEYGEVVGDLVIAELTKRGANVFAFSDGDTIGVNEKYFSDAIKKAYEDCVKSGFHPSTGSKSALEATIAHEMGHNLSAQVAQKLGLPGMDAASTRIVKEALKNTSHRGVVIMARQISGYATHSNSEAVAEAVSDVYCNRGKAKAESKAIVNVINKYLK